MEKVFIPAADNAPAVKRKRKVSFRQIRWEYWLMVLPGLIVLLINNYIPMFGIVIAFKRYRNLGNYFLNIINSPIPTDINGNQNLFENFAFLFKGPDAWTIVRNTVGYNIIFIFVGLVLAVFFAILLSELRNKRVSKIYQSTMFLPYFLSWVVISYIAYAFLAPETGFINRAILEPLGVTNHIQFYSENIYWPFLLVFFNMWKYTGYNCVVYLAAITAIDTELFEAAAIDGASRWQQIRNITIPLLQPLMIILTVLAVGRVFNADFGLFYQVTRNQGPLFPTTNVIDTYVFRALMNNNNIGMSSAAGLFQSVVGFAFVFTANAFVRKLDRDKAVF